MSYIGVRLVRFKRNRCVPPWDRPLGEFDASMHRLFLGLAVLEAVSDQALDLMDEGLPVRWQEEAQLHLTLRFVGEIERPAAEDLAAAVSGVRFDAFEIALEGVGRFARRRGGALWTGVAPREPVKVLAARLERLCQQVGLEPEHRTFHPHLTLARWNGPEPAGVGPWLERHAGFASDGWTVDALTLFESHLGRAGARYEAVLEVPAG